MFKDEIRKTHNDSNQPQICKIETSDIENIKTKQNIKYFNN